MGERFSIDLPPRFLYKESDARKRDKELEDYLNKFSIQVEEMFKRLFNRTSQPSSWTVFTLSNDATPSVGGGRLFITGGTTTITDFDDGVEGQVITVVSEHTITITDGTNIFLSVGGNWTMTATDTLTLMCKADNKWYEVSRSDNT